MTKRPLNKDAMIGTLRVVWKISKDAEITMLDTNLFLIKFETIKDKERVLEGAPWSFDKNLLAFKEYNEDMGAAEYVFNSLFLYQGVWAPSKHDDRGNSFKNR